MNEQYDNTNTGVLFKNDKKTTDKHPDYKGSVNVEAMEFWISAWIKKSKDGRNYMSLAFTPKETAVAPAPSDNDKTDDVPF